MNLLLDTHALLWWFLNDSRLSPRVRAAIGDSDNRIFVSAASAWEIAIKHRIGRLREVPEACSRFEELVAADGFDYLPISHIHGLRAGSYTAAHCDPFDRILAAQAEIERLRLASCDRAFEGFPVNLLW